MKIINIDIQSNSPKYKQIVASVEVAIAENRLKRNDKLPTVNKLSLEYSISRDTVLLAYDALKKRGIIYAILGKGYYVKSVQVTIQQKIFLLFDELNIFKEDIYNSFLENIGKDVQVDIFFHHFNSQVFQKLIKDANGNYTKYIIMPTNLADAASIIKLLPENDVFILDQTNPELMNYPSVHQNFTKNIYDAMQKGKSRLDKYEKMILIFPGFREPIGMKIGFEQFCQEFNFEYEILTEFKNREIKLGEVYLIPNDRDLVRVIEKSEGQALKLGQDFGIISYNETPLKKVVANGITTISTNFEAMGKIVALMILNAKREQVENECSLIMRNSL